MDVFLKKLVFLFGVLATTFGLQAQESVIISEFMASNSHTLSDEDGDYPDWVEIANTGNEIVSLAGWYLTDDSANLKKWQFPATNIAGGKLLIVFASGKDRRTPGLPLHTSFKLSAGGEYLVW